MQFDELIQQIEENGELRREEADQLREALCDLCSRIGDALYSAGVWGSEIAYFLSDDRVNPGTMDPTRRSRFLRPSLRTGYVPKVTGPHEKPYVPFETVIVEVWVLEYHPFDFKQSDEAAPRAALKTARWEDRERYPLSSKHLSYDQTYKTVFFSEGEVSKIEENDSAPFSNPETSDEIESMKPVVERIEQERRIEDDLYRVGYSGNRARASRDENPARVIEYSFEKPFIPRKIAVSVAENLLPAAEKFAEYVEGLAVETKAAREQVEAIGEKITTDSEPTPAA